MRLNILKKFSSFVIMLLLFVFPVSAGLDSYPSMFLDGGEWSGLVVVGENAAVSDVVGAVDVTATISETFVENDTIDEMLISSTLEFFVDSLSSKESSITGSSLNTLADSSFNNTLGTFDYVQKIDMPNAVIRYLVDPDDSDKSYKFYLYIPESTTAYVYKLEFDTSLNAKHETSPSDYIYGIEGETITMLGKEYHILDTEHAAQNRIKLTLFGGNIKETMEEGQSKTFTVDGKDYEVSVDYIGESTVKMKVNGEMSNSISSSGTYKFDDGVEVGITDILPQNLEGEVDKVEFNLGNEKIVLDDTDTTTNDFGGTVTFDDNKLDEVGLNIHTLLDEGISDGNEIKIKAIEINYTPSDDLYIPVGGKLSDVADKAEDQEGTVFLDGFDIELRNINEEVSESIYFKPSGSTSYFIGFTNRNGQKYSQEVISCIDSPCSSIALGELSGATFYDLVINESENISEDEFFILDQSKYSHIMKLKSIRNSSNTVSIKDVAVGGSSYEIAYDADTGLGEINLDGLSKSYGINVSGSTICVDMNANGLYNDTVNTLYNSLKAKITLNTGENNISITTEEHASLGTDTVYAGVSWDSSNSELDINDSFSTGYLYGFDAGAMQASGSEIEEGYVRYGMHALWNKNPSQTNIEWVYPDDQPYANVYISGRGTNGKSNTSTTVSLLGKNVSALDSEVKNKTAYDLVLIGGPCANSLTAEIMGNPSPCHEGFEDGEAIIQLYEKAFGGNNSVIVVAGSSAEDTRNAAKVLRDYNSYSLTGTKVSVKGTEVTVVS